MKFFRSLGFISLPFVAPGPGLLPPTKKLTPDQALLHLAADILVANGWTQRTLEDEDRRRCVLGAMHEASFRLAKVVPRGAHDKAMEKVLREIQGPWWNVVRHYNIPTVPVWNDHHCYTEAQAVAMLRKAAG